MKVNAKTLTAWWETSLGTWVHVSALLEDPRQRLLLPPLDQLALALELRDE